MSIDERSVVVDNRSRIRGGLEMDRVIGKGHSGALIIIVECITRFTLSMQVV